MPAHATDTLNKSDAPVPPLLLAGGAPYFAPNSSQHKHLARAWRQLGGDVLYLEVGGDSQWFKKQQAILNTREIVLEAEAGLFVMRLNATFNLPWSYPEALRQFNLHRYRPRVKGALEKLNFPARQFIALYYGWFWDGWLGHLNAASDVYDCIDEHREYAHVAPHPRFQKHVWDNEQRMLKKADLLLVTSEVLLKDRESLTKRSVVLPHAVASEAFTSELTNASQEPEDLRDLPRPRLLLSGNLQPKLDFSILESLAVANNDWQFLLVGPVEKGVTLPASRANLHWLGSKPFDLFPSYLTNSDIGLVPLLDTKYNRASSPLKVLEYLAAGLPVVTSVNPVTEKWHAEFPEYIHLAKAASDWPAACNKALESRKRFSSAARSQAVSQKTYLARARRILNLVR